MVKNEVKWGAILSYILIALNTVYGLFLTPFIIGQLGEAEYGVYKVIASLSSSLMVLDFGIGSTVMRYVASYKARDEEEKIPNFIAMNLIQSGILCVVVLIVAGGVFLSIKPIYADSFTTQQINKAQILFIVLTINMLIHMIENVINGILTGSNHFVFGNGVKLVRLCLRIAFVFILLHIFSDSLVLVLIDLVITIVFLIVEIFYVKFVLKVRIQYTHWDKTVFSESGKYTIMMFLTSIVAQVNNNLDNLIIGAISGPELVTIYSMGLLIFSMFQNLSTSVSGVMLPTISGMLEEEHGDAKVQNFIIKVGRLQFMLLGAAVVGFICVGKNFIGLWLGDTFADVYIIALILMIPALFELCVNICLTVLRAKNMLGFRTIVLVASTILNTIVTVLCVKYWSYIGAALGTALSFIIGSLIIMNLYYKKTLGFHMIKIYKKIVSRIWVCLLVAGGALYLISELLPQGWLFFGIEVAGFCVIYGGMLLIFGFSADEKKMIPFLYKFLK